MNTIIGTRNLARILNITTATIYNYCKVGMPYMQKANKRIFELDKVQEWIINEMK